MNIDEFKQSIEKLCMEDNYNHSFDYTISGLNEVHIQRILIKTSKFTVYDPFAQKVINISKDLEDSLKRVEYGIYNININYPMEDRLLTKFDDYSDHKIYRFNDKYEITNIINKLFNEEFIPRTKNISFALPVLNLDPSTIILMPPHLQKEANNKIVEHELLLKEYHETQDERLIIYNAIEGDLAARILIVVFNKCHRLLSNKDHKYNIFYVNH